MQEAQEHKAKRIAIAIAAAAAAILAGHAIITGQPINDPCDGLHGQSRITCAKEAGANTKADYAHRGEITGPYDELPNQL